MPINFKNATWITTNTMSFSFPNIDYQEALTFQKQSQKFIKNNPEKKILIFCSHPNCFTLGRGLRRNKNCSKKLTDFDPRQKTPFPLHKINRGGGLTFHHLGQWILYPIFKISPKIELQSMMSFFLESTTSAIEQTYHIKDIVCCFKSQGLWYKDKKIASQGIGLNQFITEHGLALNINIPDEMKQALKLLHPCGIQGSQYSSLEDITGQSSCILRDQLQNNFLKIIKSSSLF